MFKYLKNDLPASIVVFFVALPLCLGIALASGAPLFSGLISGIVGGIIVGAMSGSQIGVSGPAAGLAAILFIVGFKLAKPSLFKKMYDMGWKQFVPFIVTVLGIVFTDLLIGIGLGLAVGIVDILIKSYQNSHFLHKEREDINDGKIKMTLAEEVTFFNKGAILKELDKLQEDSFLELDVRKTRYLDNDIIEILDDFSHKAKLRNISIKLISERGTVENPASYIEFFKLRSKSA